MNTTNLLKLLPILGLGILISCGEKKQEDTSSIDEKVKVNTTVANIQTVDKLSTYTANVEADVINQITPAIDRKSVV